MQPRFTAHCGSSHSGTAKAQKLFAHVGRDVSVVGILHVAAINAKCRTALLSMGGKHRSQINSARTLSAVESPHALDGERVHIHGFGAIAPARCYGERDVNARLLELLGASSALAHTAYGGVGNNHLHRFAIRVTYILFKKFGCSTSHVHRLFFKRFAHLEHAAAAVDGWTDADYRVITHKSVFCHTIGI